MHSVWKCFLLSKIRTSHQMYEILPFWGSSYTVEPNMKPYELYDVTSLCCFFFGLPCESPVCLLIGLITKYILTFKCNICTKQVGISRSHSIIARLPFCFHSFVSIPAEHSNVHFPFSTELLCFPTTDLTGGWWVEKLSENLPGTFNLVGLFPVLELHPEHIGANAAGISYQ